MAGVSSKEIKNRIRSMESTRQITKAMEMVAASKLRRAQSQVLSSRPYFETLYATINEIVDTNRDFSSPYLVARPVRKIAYVVIAGDRGLAGGYNSNILKLCFAEMAQKCENIFYYGRIPYDRTIALEKECDVMCAIYDPKVPNHYYAAPNKFYEALMLGMPLIMAKGTGSNQQPMFEREDIPENIRPLYDIAGREVFIQLVESFGGQSVYIPKMETLERRPRTEAIRAEYNGANMSQLAIKYGLTARHIYNIVHGR